MNLIGNIIWVIFGGILLSLGYLFGGLVLCLTIVGIPFGVQIMKLGLFALWPFGGEVVQSKTPMGCLSILLNVLWIIFGGCPRSPHDGCNLLYHNHWNPIWFAALQTYDARSYAIWQYDCL